MILVCVLIIVYCPFLSDFDLDMNLSVYFTTYTKVNLIKVNPRMLSPNCNLGEINNDVREFLDEIINA